MKYITQLPLALALIVGSVTSPVFADDGYYGGKEDGHHDGHHKGKLEKSFMQKRISPVRALLVKLNSTKNMKDSSELR